MRITALELGPYGHLAYAQLDLTAPAGGPGLHVIRGRNGAGKSTTMRALDGAMFGIGRRTPDAHTHPGPALKIGLSLQTGDGQMLRVERRKRDGQSLLAPDGSPVDEAVLREALGGLAPEEFRAMFLLDCEKLEAGSADLLAGRGLLGQALFGAALGFGRVHAALVELEEEAQALWLKGGSRALTQQIKLLGEARRQKRQERLDPEELARLQRELADIEQELDELKASRRELTERLERTRRYQRCLPLITRRAQLQAQHEELPTAPSLPASFVDDVCAARRELTAAQARMNEISEELERVDGELAENPEPGPIADRETAIKALYQRAGESVKAASDLPRRQGDLSTRAGVLGRLLAQAGLSPELDCVDRFRIIDGDRARLSELADERVALNQAREDAKASVARLGRQIHDLEQEKPATPALSDAAFEALSEAIEAARAAGDLDAASAAAREAAAERWAEARRACAALPLWDGDVEALELLAVPVLSTVQRFEREHGQIELAGERLDERGRELDARAKELDQQSLALSAGPQAPTRVEVGAARERRDGALTALIATPGASDASAVRSEIRTADELADARADHAEIAAARDRLERDRAKLTDERAQLRSDRRSHERLTNHFAQRWAAQWSGLRVQPLAPQEMRDWLTARSEILAKAQAAREQEGLASRNTRAIEQHRRALSRHLQTAPTTGDDSRLLQPVLRQARSLLSAEADARRALAQYERDGSRLRDDLAQARARLAEAKDALARWTNAWEPVVATIGLPANASPAQARAQLSALDALVTAFDEAAALRHRVERLEADQASFAADASALAAELASDLADAQPLAIVEELHARMVSARAVRATRRQLEPQQGKLTRQHAVEVAKHTTATKQLNDLGQRAGVGVDALDALCEHIEQRTKLTAELQGVESELVAAGAASLSELVDALARATPEALLAAVTDDEDEAARVEARSSDLERKAGALRLTLDGCGGEEAALAAEQEARARAAVLNDYERYTELALAAALLRAGIERHRKQNEGPLLRRAGELFARLSAGTMSGLSVVTSQKNPYIMGVLADQREVPVDGMSAGQRHQLFLALRLASLERHFEHNEPMPLILDDLLVQLDDVSARAALEILVELSRGVQVLFFTHHDHLVAMARETVPADLLVEHEIGEAPLPALRAA